MTNLILSQIFFLLKIKSTISDTIYIQNTTDYIVEYFESPTVTSYYPDVRNFSLEDSNLTNATVYETVVERVTSLLDIFLTPCLVTLGISGNLLSLYVFYSSKLRHQSTSQYLSALAVSDSVFLAELIPPWLSTMEITNVFNRDPYCKGFVYISYVSCSLSSWLVIAFTIERFVAVQYPLRSHSLCTVRRARYIIAALTIGAMLVNIPVINFAGSINQTCQIRREKLEQAAKFNWVDTTFTFTIPLILTVFFNTWIAVVVYKLEKDRLKLAQLEQIRQQKSSEYDSVYLRSQRRITNMLLIVSTTFVLLNCPAYTLRVCGYAYDMDSRELDEKWLIVQNIATMLFNVNFGINFFLYCLTGQNFRRALVQTVPCFGWLADKVGVVNRPTINQARTCNVTTSAENTGTDIMYMETSFARRADTGPDQRRSGDYIMRWTFDNSRQRHATAVSGASDFSSMPEITLRPGPSRDFTDDRMRAGTSHDLLSGQTRAIIESRRSDIDRRRPTINLGRPTFDSRRPAIETGYSTVHLMSSRIEAGTRHPNRPQVTVLKKRKTSCI